MSQIIDGKLVSQNLREKIRIETKNLIKKAGTPPHLAVIIVGDNPASATYVRNKGKACESVGFKSTTINLPETTTEPELLSQIEKLNTNNDVHGILVQLPLPSHINEQNIIQKIEIAKDVDGFHPYQMGALVTGLPSLKPCTPAGIIELLKHYNIPIAGSSSVIIGRSNIVGKPIASLLLEENATVTITHSKTKNLAEITSQADILVVAIGREKFVTANMIKKGAVIIDVGINRTSEGKLVGDVDFCDVKEKATHITPVPGGVGPMTITMLLKNTLEAFKNQLSRKT